MAIAASINIPESILLSLRDTAENVGLEMKRALALQYYTDKRLSLGQCSELAEMNEASFMRYLAKRRVSIFSFDSEQELLEDIHNA